MFDFINSKISKMSNSMNIDLKLAAIAAFKLTLIKNSKSLQPRLGEEERLPNLREETLKISKIIFTFIKQARI
ncbi:hypothetical protein BpHYR1_029065 [Brachionus plicatilis]|uniref:Uncharacterized protein n=1 Tax=Brachionus plicatilis TaxID=10195 RepID=A0A3M7Q9Q4_BRAPC|nr:hypothetical protein BpHYR1_029065 [Brachionus plicatilis]